MRRFVPLAALLIILVLVVAAWKVNGAAEEESTLSGRTMEIAVTNEGQIATPLIEWDHSSHPDVDNYVLERCHWDLYQSCGYSAIITLDAQYNSYYDSDISLDPNGSHLIRYQVVARNQYGGFLEGSFETEVRTSNY